MGAIFRVDTAHTLGVGHEHALTEPGTTLGGRSSQLIPAKAADHAAIHQFLLAVFQEPSLTEFQHANEAPRYEPLDRVLIKRRGEIVAHLQLSHRTLQFGDLTIPAIDLRHLGTLPEYRSQGLAGRLLRAMETDTNLHGALLATVLARTPEIFSGRGWVPWLHQCFSIASPRCLISQLEMSASKSVAKRSGPIRTENTIRLWRRNELDALRRLYQLHSTRRYGGLARDESDWQWLICRQGFDRIYVALSAGGPSCDPSPDLADIIGYAVVKDGQVVELTAQPETDAARQLLIRVCGDAIENGRHSIAVHAAPGDPLHSWFQRANGRHECSEQIDGRQLFARVLRPFDLLRKLRKTLTHRAVKAGLPIPSQLGLRIGNRRIRINLSKRQATLLEGHLGRSYLSLSPVDFDGLLLGQTNTELLLQSNRATASTRVAVELAQALFPQLPTWRMPWDNLASRVQ